jgi:hypothetical protein
MLSISYITLNNIIAILERLNARAGVWLIVRFVEHLQNITTNSYYSPIWVTHSKDHCTYSTRKNLLNLVCLHHSLPGDGFQGYFLLPCSRSYMLSTVSQLTHCSNYLLSNRSQSYVKTDGQSTFGVRHPSGAHDQIITTVRHLKGCWCGAFSPMSVQVCSLELQLALASAVIRGSESRRAHGYVLLSQTS